MGVHNIAPEVGPSCATSLPTPSACYLPQFGSGECGQCAHGNDTTADILVTAPRVVYSLRDKNVCSVACGGLHNVALTSEGKVGLRVSGHHSWSEDRRPCLTT